MSIKIKVMEDGPIEISGQESIKYCGNRVESKDGILLCRCGDSKNQPFCDWAHVSAGFSGKNEIDEQQSVRKWEGKTIRTTFNANICMHAYYCRELDKIKETEETDTTASEKIAKIVASCPSGALNYQMIDSPDPETFVKSAEVEIIEGGEIRVQCEFEGVEL